MAADSINSTTYIGPPPPARRDWAYFLDFDGTLVELADAPGAVHVDAALQALLSSLHSVCDGALALVSGRALIDLDRRIGLPDIAKAGQHGLERRDAQGHVWRHPAPIEAKEALVEALASILERHPGLLLEDKGMTLALHYRRAPELASFSRELMYRLVDEIGSGFAVQEGKCVFEAKPVNFDKGSAVEAYLAEPPFRGRRPVFIGDDSTDEHGFIAVNERDGISIGVGPECINARYILADVAAVRDWLAAATNDISV